jgi:hypothetical protein
VQLTSYWYLSKDIANSRLSYVVICLTQITSQLLYLKFEIQLLNYELKASPTPIVQVVVQLEFKLKAWRFTCLAPKAQRLNSSNLTIVARKTGAVNHIP